MTNRERAHTARTALQAFTLRTYGGRTPEELGAPPIDDGIAGTHVDDDVDAQTMVADLICDLGHYCRAVGLDYDEQLDRAAFHYREERVIGWEDEE